MGRITFVELWILSMPSIQSCVTTPISKPIAEISITTSFWFSFFVSEHFHTEGDASRWLVFTAHYLGLFGFGLSIGDGVEIGA